MNKNFIAICATFLMCAVLIVFYLNPKLSKSTVTFAESSPKKVIYLTFDDGPSDKVTPRILDVLKEENVKATFFIVGKNAVQRKYLIKREIDEGHTVGVHSYSHDYGEIYASTDSLLKDIDKCNDIIKEVTGKPAKLYRFPGGSFGIASSFIDAVTAKGLRYVDWNASTCDAEISGATPEQLLNCAITTPANRNNVVLLAHDTTTKSATADALKDIIKYYKNLNYTFASF